jgi:hypothetical protein
MMSIVIGGIVVFAFILGFVVGLACGHSVGFVPPYDGYIPDGWKPGDQE